MKKCVADFEEGLELEYTTVEFAAELGVSARTIEGWRISRRGKPPKLPADHTDERGRAVYTTEQLENARALLQRNQKTTASTTAESMSEPTTDDKPVEENHAAQIESTATIEAVTELIIDDEFKALIPPLADNERAQLEENLLRDGIQDSLKTWQGILIDGHNRYSIAQKHGLTFKTMEMQFDDRDAVKRWIIENQFGRRNINRYSRGELALKLEATIAERAKENLSTHTTDGYQRLANLPKGESINTRDELAKIAGVSSRTMATIKFLVDNATEEIKTALRSDQLSINAAHEAVKAGATTVNDVLNFKASKKTPPVTVTEPARQDENHAEASKTELPPLKVQHGEESTDKDNIVTTQIDDDTAKLVVGNKPLDSCRGIVCIDDAPQRDDAAQSNYTPADNALISARATVQMALAAVTAAIEKNDDPEALEAAAQALHAIRAELEAKKISPQTPRAEREQQ